MTCGRICVSLLLASVCFVASITDTVSALTVSMSPGIEGVVSVLSHPGRGLFFIRGKTNTHGKAFSFSFSAVEAIGEGRGRRSYAAHGAAYALGKSGVICVSMRNGDLLYSESSPTGTLSVLFDPRKPQYVSCSTGYALRILLRREAKSSQFEIGYRLGHSVSIYYDFGSMLAPAWLLGPIRMQYQYHPLVFAASSPLPAEERDLYVRFNRRSPGSSLYLVRVARVSIHRTPENAAASLTFFDFAIGGGVRLLPVHHGDGALLRAGFRVSHVLPDIAPLFAPAAPSGPLRMGPRASAMAAKFRKWAGISSQMLRQPKIVWPVGWQPLGPEELSSRGSAATAPSKSRRPPPGAISGGASSEEPKSLRSLLAEAAKGDSAAMTNVGMLYQTGHDVLRNYAKAMSWYQRAVAAGYAPAMVNIGLMYFKGQGVPKDVAKARAWFEKAAAAGDPRGKQALEELKEIVPVGAQK